MIDERIKKYDALMLLLNWAVECGFGYDNFPEEYERYENDVKDMEYIEGMIYIAEKVLERKRNDWVRINLDYSE